MIAAERLDTLTRCNIMSTHAARLALFCLPWRALLHELCRQADASYDKWPRESSPGPRSPTCSSLAARWTISDGVIIRPSGTVAYSQPCQWLSFDDAPLFFCLYMPTSNIALKLHVVNITPHPPSPPPPHPPHPHHWKQSAALERRTTGPRDQLR